MFSALTALRAKVPSDRLPVSGWNAADTHGSTHLPSGEPAAPRLVSATLTTRTHLAHGARGVVLVYAQGVSAACDRTVARACEQKRGTGRKPCSSLYVLATRGTFPARRFVAKLIKNQDACTVTVEAKGGINNGDARGAASAGGS